MMRRILVTLVVAVLLASCSGGGGEGGDATTPSASGPPTTQAAANGAIDAKFDVGGHQLHLTCRGTGSPTVVYLHGHSQRPGDASGDGAGLIPTLVAEQHHRFCGYDRANTGNSDKVPGPLDGETTIADMHRLLQAARIEPPYILLGASFGGLFAYMYAVTYPKEVAGMVLLDASFPEELELERHFPKEERWDHSEWKTLEEQVDQLTTYQQAHAMLGKEPAIPVTYLLATPSGWTGPPAYEAVVLDHIANYVDRFSPGVLEEVESPHYMEAAVPERIAQELEQIIANP
jgi:pimeloyl-ACP methyl ester carboxylesterase